MFPRDICLPSGSWLTGWQFVCEKGRKSVKSAYEFVLIHDAEKKAVFSPPSLNLASVVGCLPLPTCSHSTLFWPYFLLIIMWIIKVQVHETHTNYRQWARNRPGLSHGSGHKLRPKYSWCKLGVSLSPAEFIVTCSSLKTCHFQGKQQAKDPSLPKHHGDHWLLFAFHWCYISRRHSICFESPTCFIWPFLLRP